MKNLIYLLSLLLLPISATATSLDMEEVKVLLKIHSIAEAEKMIGHPIVVENIALKQELKKLGPGDEVLLKGFLEYYPVSNEGNKILHPTFHLQSIHPISLARLGEIEQVVNAPIINLKTQTYETNPLFRTTPEVTNSLILTASILLFQNISTAPDSSNKVTSSLNSGLILSAGLLATSYFLWEQLSYMKISSKP